jgi:hypothetical protein
MADEKIQALLAQLQSENLDHQFDAVYQLTELKAREAVPALIEMLDADDMGLKLAVIDALGNIGDERAIPHLARIAHETGGPVRSQAATALFHIGTPEALAVLEEWRDGDDYKLGAPPPAEPEPELDDQVSRKRAAEQPPMSPPPPAPGSAIFRDSEKFSLEDAEPEIRQVQFSAYYPREVRPDDWQPLQAYVFKQSAAQQVEEDAEKQIGPLSAFRKLIENARSTIAEGEMITATPHLPGFQFNPPTVTIGFFEDWHRFEFKMRARTAPLHHAANGFLTFTVNGIIVADIPLSVFVSPQAVQSPAQPTPAQPLYDTVFASYSHRDTAIVEKVEASIKALGLTYLRDVVTLRSGQHWSDELLRMIDEATIFQLFWSEASSQSQYCRQEWEYALSLQRDNQYFIRPVYWTQPLPPPPANLGHLHFAYQADLVK